MPLLRGFNSSSGSVPVANVLRLLLVALQRVILSGAKIRSPATDMDSNTRDEALALPDQHTEGNSSRSGGGQSPAHVARRPDTAPRRRLVQLAAYRAAHTAQS